MTTAEKKARPAARKMAAKGTVAKSTVAKSTGAKTPGVKTPGAKTPGVKTPGAKTKAAKTKAAKTTVAVKPTATSLASRAISQTTGMIRTLAGISTTAVAMATGHGWSYWLKALDKAGAATLPHGEIAKLLSKTLGLKHPWWVQMVAVAYEQARGLRQPRERKNGFAATVTRTVAVPINALYAAWEEGRRGDWLPDGIEVRRATKNKSMKITWPDGSGIDVNFYDKGGNKAVVAIEQTQLRDPTAVEAVKDLWGAALDRLKATLERKG